MDTGRPRTSEYRADMIGLLLRHEGHHQVARMEGATSSGHADGGQHSDYRVGSPSGGVRPGSLSRVGARCGITSPALMRSRLSRPVGIGLVLSVCR
jgi:hypothetical protein